MNSSLPEIEAKRWINHHPPCRILAIRLQALGDTVITFPWLNGLKKLLPASAEIDFLTRKETASIPRTISFFHRVYAIGGGRNTWKQIASASLLIPVLAAKRYDVIIDLQNNTVSRYVRKLLSPKAWSAFDRFSPFPAGLRTERTIQAAGFPGLNPDMQFMLNPEPDINQLLLQHGYSPGNRIIILNPAGAFPSRNWPTENYAAFAFCWKEKYPASQFLIAGTSAIEEKAKELQNLLGNSLINLVNNTTAAQAFTLVRQAALVLSEDSGLMHMAWVNGIPTVAIFGSTRSDWSRPLGEFSYLFDSSGLPCANCMQELCRYGDNHCITRHSPDQVFQQAEGLFLASLTSRQTVEEEVQG